MAIRTKFALSATFSPTMFSAVVMTMNSTIHTHAGTDGKELVR